MLDRVSRRALVLALGLVALSTVGASTANAAPPVNDDFVDQISLADPTSNTENGTNAEATQEFNEAAQLGYGGSVWYTWSPATDGTAHFSTCTSNHDNTMSIFTGNVVGGLTFVASDDDSCDVSQGNNPYGAIVTFAATAGTQYRIAVVAFGSGPFQFGTFTLIGPQAPPPVIPRTVTPFVTPVTPVVTLKQPAKKKKKKKKKKKSRK